MKNILNKLFSFKKKSLFVCQFNQNSIKVIKCLHSGIGREFIALAYEELPADTNEENLFGRLNQILKTLGYNNDRLIVSLSRQNVTSRYIKVPSQKPEEIERIATFQSPKYLPYSMDELVTGYQVVSTDKQGYTNITLNIMHKDVINRLVNNFQKLKISNFSITLGSYGIRNLYNFCAAREEQPVILIDSDSFQAEIAVIGSQKLLLSRYVRIPQNEDPCRFLAEEINKTKEAYLKEVSTLPPAKIIVLGSPANAPTLADRLKPELNLAVTHLPYAAKINAQKDFVEKLSGTEKSFAALIGLALKEVPLSLDFLPQDKKEEAKKKLLLKKRLERLMLLCGIILISALGLAKSMSNKADYLKRLNRELVKIEKEAQPLALLEKRSRFLQGRLQKPSTLTILHELYQIVPAQVSLTSLTYEENSSITVRGQTTAMDGVLAFVDQLEKSKVFKAFNIKPKYASKRKSSTGEIIDFEIGCLRK
ncbi:MAG: pilus assembly protein PilM [Candidatus Omnitrophota bacterium]